MKDLTSLDYWENSYVDLDPLNDLRTSGFRGHINRLIIKKIAEVSPANKSILEIGAGNSMWLPYLAKKFPNCSLTGLDYTETGCALLLARSQKSKLNINVVKENMFCEISQHHNSFDIVLSFGVVEHFSNLSNAMNAKKKYAKKNGLILTIIPNLSGILGHLAKKWNIEVYKKHNPHDLESFVIGHKEAGLEVLCGDYLGSNNFGVLAGCFPSKTGVNWQINKGLIALSQASWLFESRIATLPATKAFSPYIYAISRVPES